MQKEQINNKEGICLLALFTMGSTLILGSGGAAKNDAWIAGILGIIMAIPMLIVYIRILAAYPGQSLYDIVEISMGRIAGKIVSIIYVWYSFHLGALVIRNFGEFINTVAMPETPILFTMLCLGIVCILTVNAGVEVLGRVSAFCLPVQIFIIVVVQLLVIPLLNFENIKPILANGLSPVLMGGFSAFSFPYAETSVFMGIFFSLKRKTSIPKVYFSGIFIAAFFIIILTLRNIFVLGNEIERLYFPAHVAVSHVSIGEFIERIEVTVAIVFVFGVFIKTSVCLLSACKGIEKLFKLNNYRSIVIQTGLLMIYFAHILYDNIMEMQLWAFRVYPYYAFPFQVIIPVIILISVEIKKRRKAS